MPSNKQLIEDITAEATAKNIDVPETDGKSNADLAAILKTMKDAPAAPPPPEADDDEPEPEATKEPEPEADTDDEPDERPPYYVADGKSITSRKDMLKPGDEVKAEYVGGEDRLNELVKSGVVKKR